jgi:hypothetical protein
MTDFVPFQKIPRLNRGIVVTEKIDGTNACVDIRDIEAIADSSHLLHVWPAEDGTGRTLGMRAGSRSRWLRTTKDGDNYGFAKWVDAHASQLTALGEGQHFGEWWGNGIQHGYGLDHKRFSLFNVARWGTERPSCCGVVPVLYEGLFSHQMIQHCLRMLEVQGSIAAAEALGEALPPALHWTRQRPVAEGVIVYHTASRQLFKVTLDNDGEPKSKAVQRQLDAQAADVCAPEPNHRRGDLPRHHLGDPSMTTNAPTVLVPIEKPVVRYRGRAVPFMGSAYLQAVGHPRLGNTNVTTSQVQSWDEETGRIETLNTVYLPEEKSNAAA